MTRGAGRRLVGRLALLWMTYPRLRFGCMTAPTCFARGIARDGRVFGSFRQRGWFAADQPEDSEEGDYSDGDREKIIVLSIHKAAQFVAPRVSCLKSRI